MDKFVLLQRKFIRGSGESDRPEIDLSGRDRIRAAEGDGQFMHDRENAQYCQNAEKCVIRDNENSSAHTQAYHASTT
ncbi:hypothetical protein [Cohnella thailandensis]|uniref:hypothetical protein n=1 Tax=Cohnella thailandensis TaxID=557557 RepID=UPI001E1649A4|nr:hypothetical protein [Cohnella thailandensis]